MENSITLIGGKLEKSSGKMFKNSYTARDNSTIGATLSMVDKVDNLL